MCFSALTNDVALNLLIGFFIGYCVAYNRVHCILNKRFHSTDESSDLHIGKQTDIDNIDLQCGLKHTKKMNMKTKMDHILREYQKCLRKNEFLVNENRTLVETVERLSIRNRTLCKFINKDRCKGFLVRTNLSSHCNEDAFPLVRIASNEI